MNELNNTAVVQGTYNNIPTQVTSNTSVVNIIEGLTMNKQADKENWSSGNLTYTITLENKTDTTYVSPIITDVINTDLVDFVNDSVMIDDVKAETSEYSYSTDTKTLTINLSDIPKDTSRKVTFMVKKKDTANHLG